MQIEYINQLYAVILQGFRVHLGDSASYLIIFARTTEAHQASLLPLSALIWLAASPEFTGASLSRFHNWIATLFLVKPNSFSCKSSAAAATAASIDFKLTPIFHFFGQYSYKLDNTKAFLLCYFPVLFWMRKLHLARGFYVFCVSFHPTLLSLLQIELICRLRIHRKRSKNMKCSRLAWLQQRAWL